MAPVRMLLPSVAKIDESVARDFAAWLSKRVGAQVEFERAAYSEMESRLIAADAELGWAAPAVYARVEAYGGQVLARAVRFGSSEYRAALVARAGSTVELGPDARLRAAWVDRASVGGYLLPVVAVRVLGLPLWEVFAEERFLGSYRACWDALERGEVDVASVTVHTSIADRAVAEARRVIGSPVRMLGLSSPCANDVIVANARVPNEIANAVRDAMLDLHIVPECAPFLEKVFEAESFEPAPAGSHRQIYALLMASIPNAKSGAIELPRKPR